MTNRLIVVIIGLSLGLMACQLMSRFIGSDQVPGNDVDSPIADAATLTPTPAPTEPADDEPDPSPTPSPLPRRPPVTVEPTPTIAIIARDDLPPPTLFVTDWDDRTLFEAGLIETERGALAELPGATTYHIEVELSDDLSELTGRQQVRYTNLETEALSELYFHLYPNLLGGAITVANLTVDGTPVEPIFELGESAMQIPLAQPLQPGEQRVISMAYTISVPKTPERNYGIFAGVDGILALAHFYPLLAIYDEQGWDIEIPSPQGDVVFAESSFYLVRVTAPLNQMLVGSGVTVEQTQTDTTQTITFAAGPMRDFYLAASDQYALVSGSFGETTVNSYYLPGDLESAELALQYALDSLETFNARYGIYPFSEFDIVPTANQALGIEYPGIVAINLTLYDPRAKIGPFPTPVFFESTVVHEVAHQWFYSLVGNDQLAEPWVDEALTQYATWRYYLDIYGPTGANGFRQALQGRWDRVDGADIPIGKPVAEYEPPEYSAIVYGRGPLFFEALAEAMGQEVLDSFLLDYSLSHRYELANAAQLKEQAEAHCLCDLSSLFETWVY